MTWILGFVAWVLGNVMLLGLVWAADTYGKRKRDRRS